MTERTDPRAAVPPGHRLELPGRGVTFVRDVPGPDPAAAVVLLHGLGATTSINWPGAFQALCRDHRVVGLDQVGHGRGIRSSRTFRLEDCADDVVRLADSVGRNSPMPAAFVDEMRRHDPAAVVEALRALGRFDARPWLDQLDCPTASIVTTADGIVPPSRQLQLAHATNAHLSEVHAGHEVAVRDPAHFLPALVAACRAVTGLHPAERASDTWRR